MWVRLPAGRQHLPSHLANPMPMSPPVVVATAIRIPVTSIGSPTPSVVIIPLRMIIDRRLDNAWSNHSEGGEEESQNTEFSEHLALLVVFDGMAPRCASKRHGSGRYGWAVHLVARREFLDPMEIGVAEAGAAMVSGGSCRCPKRIPSDASMRNGWEPPTNDAGTADR